MLFADDAPKGPPSFMPLVMIGGLFLLFYLFMIRPQMRQEKERKALASNLEKNDDVLTHSGIYGTIVSLSDKEDEVTVRIAENVKVKMMRAAIIRNITKEKQFAEAKGEAPK